MVRLEGWRYLDEELNIPFPWYTSPCLEWLNSLDLKEKRIWDYGCGDSTAWFRSRGAIVGGVDSNKEWADKSGAYYTEVKIDYLQCNLRGGKFDIVVIDGDFRDECTQYALNRVKKGGFIIIDNYKQPTADLADWPITEKLIENLDVRFYKEPEHQDWQTIVIHV